jgi:molybdopterin synthase sulfur carrier subunit
MSVKVRLFAAARAAAGTESVHTPAGTLASILDGLIVDHPPLAEVLPRCSYLVDGLAVHGDPNDVLVHEGSELDVLPPFAGG